MTREEIAHILKTLRKKANMTQKDVAKHLGRTQQIVGHWETGYSQPDANTLFTLCDLYGTTVDNAFGFSKNGGPCAQLTDRELQIIDKYRLLDDRGKGVIAGVLDIEYKYIEAIRGPKEQEKESNIIKFPKREAPLYDIRVSAGTGQFLDSSSYTMIIMEEDEPPETSFLVTVTGDSMEPTYYSGDTLYIKQQPEIKVGEIGLFMINGNVFVKELAEEGLKSHNPKYPEIYFHDTDAIHCYGRVLGVREGKITTEI